METSGIQERPLDDGELEELRQLSEDGIEYICGLVDNLPTNLNAEILVRGIRSAVDAMREGRAGSAYEDLEQVAYAFGSLWGDQVKNELHWDWIYLDCGLEGYAIASPDRSIVNFPHHYIYRIISDPTQDNSIALLFNMLRAGRLPNAVVPRSYTIFH
ncbi:MAG: hypothetical protein DCE90_03610 [Pseudanabaena sp.]|nr:MAG: hypothetical protein DCE90_03610 [Pseudanabaena sp.]